MAETPCCDPNAKPLTREERLERTIEQMSAEAVERARAYDDNNAFHQRRTADLLARLATAEAEREHDHAIAEAGRAFFDAFVQTNGQAFPWMPQDLLTALVEDYDRRRAPSTGTTPP